MQKLYSTFYIYIFMCIFLCFILYREKKGDGGFLLTYLLRTALPTTQERTQKMWEVEWKQNLAQFNISSSWSSSSSLVHSWVPFSHILKMYKEREKKSHTHTVKYTEILYVKSIIKKGEKKHIPTKALTRRGKMDTVFSA